MFKFVMTKNSNEIFHRAILSNDVSRTKLILKEAIKDPRFNIDEINEEGLTALQFSCFAGNLEIAKVLISYKANYKIRDRDGNTLLHAATLAGNAEVIKYLIRIGLKPCVKNDDGQMPIDNTEDVGVIVILLRAMLDQGLLQEMQDYMLDHPKLKRNIFKELERVKCRENENNEILEDLPCSSYGSPGRQYNRVERLKSESKSLRIYSQLSYSMPQLNQITVDKRGHNNNIGRKHSVDNLYDASPSLRKFNSTSSIGSHGSRSFHHLTSSSGNLRHEPRQDLNSYDIHHRNTQNYLENRYPLASPFSCTSSLKSVSLDPDLNLQNHRNYSDSYISDSRTPLPRSSSSLSLSSSQNSVFSDSFDYQQKEEDPIYDNLQSIKPTANLATIKENL